MYMYIFGKENLCVMMQVSCFTLDTKPKNKFSPISVFVLQKSRHILANNRDVSSRIHHQLHCINEHRKY